MAILSHSSRNFILSLKVLLISTAVVSTAVILKLSQPVIMEFVLSEVPSIWSFAVSCLRPPYLYLVINCIIITIVASSKFQSTVDDDISLPVPPEPIKLPPAHVRTDYAVAYGGVDLKNEVVAVSPQLEKVLEYDVYEDVNSRVSERKTAAITVNDSDQMNGGDEFVISKSSRTALDKDPTEYSLSPEKPLVSARFTQRKSVKATPEGGRTLSVSKQKRQDTLESTWKTITDGRPMPLTRHLRKSDTWETHGRQEHPHQRMAKSETFNERSSVKSSNNSGKKLRKEASPSQDELNKRVEAFINKFNEDMRLQRQESLNQYMEMINRGAH